MVYVYAPEADFLMPYFKREITLGDENSPIAVMISSTDVYSPLDGWADEESGIDADSVWAKREKEFSDAALRNGAKAYILRCAPIIGTGMTGEMRKLAEEIYRGRFFHFPGNEARKSIVHATDVARAVRFLSESDAPVGIYNLTDNVDPALHDIAEALAFRMSDKRISNLSTKPQQMIGRWVYGRRYRYYTTSALFSSSRIQKLGFVPTDTCRYMRTHEYDDLSL